MTIRLNQYILSICSGGSFSAFFPNICVKKISFTLFKPTNVVAFHLLPSSQTRNKISHLSFYHRKRLRTSLSSAIIIYSIAFHSRNSTFICYLDFGWRQKKCRLVFCCSHVSFMMACCTMCIKSYSFAPDYKRQRLNSVWYFIYAEGLFETSPGLKSSQNITEWTKKAFGVQASFRCFAISFL